MTIEENIALSETADENLVRQTCISAGLGVFLDKLPNNLKTQLGKNIDPEGVKLSGGEGQRLAIARSREPLNNATLSCSLWIYRLNFGLV